MKTTRLLLIPASLLAASLLSGCPGKQAEMDRLKQENARLISERDEARRELEQLRATGTTGATTTAPTPPGTPAVAAASFTDIDNSAARDEILDLARLGVFERTSGAFEPTRSITRAEFVRWLVRSNNAIRKEKDVRLAEGGAATFSDVPASHPDFRYIQGMANAGVVIGYDETTFKPDRPLSREELIGIKCGLDQGGVTDRNKDHGSVDRIWHWGDVRKISRRYLDAIYSEYFNSAKNVDRTFGAIKMLKPQQAVTRGEAAICVWRIGDGHKCRTAAEALQAAGSDGDR
jgi:outer membrane murein-binding lipoprotein Lpp